MIFAESTLGMKIVPAGTSRVLGDIFPELIMKMMIFVADWRFAWCHKLYKSGLHQATINQSGFNNLISLYSKLNNNINI